MTTHRAQATPTGRRIDGPLVAFFALAYAIAWGTFALFASIARQAGLDDAQALMALADAYQFAGVELAVPDWVVYLLARLADFSFSIAGLVMIAVTTGRSGLRTLWRRLTRFRIGWGWYVVGLLPVALYALATALADALPSVDLSLDAVLVALFSLHAGWFVSLFLRGAMGEELGLRGFALPRLQQTYSPFRSSVIIGVLWGAWHLPVLIGRDALSVAAFVVLAFGLSFLFTLVFNGSGGSLVPVLLFHASLNWEEGFEVLFPALVGTEWEIVSTLSLLVLGLVAAVLVWRRGRSRSTSMAAS
jgi:membrane protease YdiL (CAAX protease family)